MNQQNIAPTRLLRQKALRQAQQRGQTLVEYALIIAVLAIVSIGVLLTMGQQTKALYSSMTSQFSRAGS